MIPCFGSCSLTLCSSMVCFSDIACPLFNLDECFYSIERRTRSLHRSPTLFSYSPSAFTRKDREPSFCVLERLIMARRYHCIQTPFTLLFHLSLLSVHHYRHP